MFQSKECENFDDLRVITRDTHTDSRGEFYKIFNFDDLKKFGWNDSVKQINFSQSFKKGTVRGMHMQFLKYAEYKLVTCIKDGEIIALMQGNSEVGFRSLGARSILCDASITGIKDKVNLTKRREAYRPFAPVCLWKDASQYFEVGEHNIYKHMNMAVMVKEEWREKLSSITHVDNTARLQAVEEQDGFMFDLLTKHGGVLLNTSLNLSGKPICNSLYEALHILERSDIDKLVVSDLNNKLVCFEKYKE